MCSIEISLGADYMRRAGPVNLLRLRVEVNRYDFFRADPISDKFFSISAESDPIFFEHVVS